MTQYDKQQVKLAERKIRLNKIYYKLSEGLLKDCICMQQGHIYLKYSDSIIVYANANGTYSNLFSSAYTILDIDRKNVWDDISTIMTFEELMDSIKVYDRLDAEEFKRGLVAKYNWCWFINGGEVAFTDKITQSNKHIDSRNTIINGLDLFHTVWNKGLVTYELGEPLEITAETAPEIEQVFKMIDEALNPKWDLHKAMKEIAEEVDFLDWDAGRKRVVWDERLIISTDGDICLNCYPSFENHKTFNQEVKLTQENHAELLSVLKEYDAYLKMVTEHEFSWEVK